MLKSLTATLLAIAITAGSALAIEVDPAVSFTAPAASLTVPFDATEDEEGQARVSFIRVSNVGGVSPVDALGPVTQISMHIGAWDDACEHVVNVNVCLTLNSTIVVDTTKVRAAIFNPAQGVVEVGPTFNLTGRRGIVTFTAYATNRDCLDGELLGDLLVDEALMGAWSIANRATTSTFGGNPWGHGLDDTGAYVELIEPGYDLDTIYLGTYNPADVRNLVLGIGLRENAGKRGGELGPIVELVSGDSQVCDPTEHCASRPDPKASCLFVSRLDDDQLEALGSSAFFRLRNLHEEETGTPIGSTQNLPGSASMVYTVNGEDLAGLGTDTAGYYTLAKAPPAPTPTPTPVPTPTAEPCAGSCSTGFICVLNPPSPCCDCQPEPTPTPVLIPVPTVTTILVTASPAATATPVPTDSPSPTASPEPSPSPTNGAIGP